MIAEIPANHIKVRPADEDWHHRHSYDVQQLTGKVEVILLHGQRIVGNASRLDWNNLSNPIVWWREWRNHAGAL